MQSLKKINDISDETLIWFLKKLSFTSKRFMEKVRKASKEQGVVISSKSLKQSFVSYIYLHTIGGL